jgi:multiple sugar transport system permease protein
MTSFCLSTGFDTVKRHNLNFKVFTYIFLSISSFIMVYPVLFMALGAFTTPSRFEETLFLPIPNALNFRIFQAVLDQGIGHSYLLTLTRVAFYVIANLSVGLVAGYIFSKLHFPGRNRVFLLFLSGMLVPAILLILPDFILMARFPLAGGNNILGQGGHGFINNWPALFAFGWVSPFAIFLLKQSYDMLPTEYEEAAKMDGAGLFTIIFRVYGPLLKPPIVALVIIISVGIWNDYLWPLQSVISRPDLYTIAVALKGVSVGGDYLNPGLMIQVLMAVWPPAALYLLLQRYFVQGLLASGLKG